MNNEEQYKTLLKHIHTDLLKERGFKKVGQSFRLIKEVNGGYYGCIINFQKSAYNDKTKLRFTVNAGRKFSSEKIPESFKIYDCRIPDDYVRLASLSQKYGSDKWWSITSETDMTATENEIKDLIKSTGFSFFDIC